MKPQMQSAEEFALDLWDANPNTWVRRLAARDAAIRSQARAELLEALSAEFEAHRSTLRNAAPCEIADELLHRAAAERAGESDYRQRAAKESKDAR